MRRCPERLEERRIRQYISDIPIPRIIWHDVRISCSTVERGNTAMWCLYSRRRRGFGKNRIDFGGNLCKNATFRTQRSFMSVSVRNASLIGILDPLYKNTISIMCCDVRRNHGWYMRSQMDFSKWMYHRLLGDKFETFGMNTQSCWRKDHSVSHLHWNWFKPGNIQPTDVQN